MDASSSSYSTSSSSYLADQVASESSKTRDELYKTNSTNRFRSNLFEDICDRYSSSVNKSLLDKNASSSSSTASNMASSSSSASYSSHQHHYATSADEFVSRSNTPGLLTSQTHRPFAEFSSLHDTRHRDDHYYDEEFLVRNAVAKESNLASSVSDSNNNNNNSSIRFGVKRVSSRIGDESNVGELNSIFQKMYARHRNSMMSSLSSREEHQQSSSSSSSSSSSNAAARGRYSSFSNSNH